MTVIVHVFTKVEFNLPSFSLLWPSLPSRSQEHTLFVSVVGGMRLPSCSLHHIPRTPQNVGQGSGPCKMLRSCDLTQGLVKPSVWRFWMLLKVGLSWVPGEHPPRNLSGRVRSGAAAELMEGLSGTVLSGCCFHIR